MPEEINRVLTDHISNYLFCPTTVQQHILYGEGIIAKDIHVVGNTIVDAVMRNAAVSRSYFAESGHPLSGKEYFIATIHRPENSDNKEKLEMIMKGLGAISLHYNKPLLLPLHPRTQDCLKRFGIDTPAGVEIMGPKGYIEFLYLMENALAVLTDSGGIQEEACILRVPCVTLRNDTERPETVEVGANRLAGSDPDLILDSLMLMMNSDKNWTNPFGDGNTGRRIIQILNA